MSANKFDWNEVVRVKKNAPEKLRPGEIASICGVTEVEFEDVAEKFHTHIGEWIYTIEFKDGTDVDLAEHCLEKLNAQ